MERAGPRRPYRQARALSPLMMPSSIPVGVGDRVRVNLDPAVWHTAGWFDGTIIRIDPYSAHRSFYWVELDVHVELARGGRTNLVAVLNPKHMVRI